MGSPPLIDLTADNRKCAIGLNLPNDHPAQKEQYYFDELVGRYPELFSVEIRSTSDYSLRRFQRRLHDGLIEEKGWKFSKETMREIYIEIAKEFSLKIPE